MITAELKLAWAQEWICLKINLDMQPVGVVIITDKTIAGNSTHYHGIVLHNFEEFCKYKTNQLLINAN